MATLRIVAALALASAAAAGSVFPAPSALLPSLLFASGVEEVAQDKRPFYALGVTFSKQVAANIREYLSEEELAVVGLGMSDSMAGRLTDEAQVAILKEHGEALTQIMRKRQEDKAAENKAAAEAAKATFLSENKDAVVTDTGLAFLETNAGSGAAVTEEDTVTVHYEGTLSDGTVFDSTRKRGKAATLEVKSVVKGFSEALLRMKEGGSATFIIPPELGFGKAGVPPVIPPGASLRFEVEVLEVKKTEETPSSEE